MRSYSLNRKLNDILLSISVELTVQRLLEIG
jgi:hypothetical protein